MRIAFVIDHARPGKGGLEGWLQALAEHLRAGGREVHLVTMDRASVGPWIHHALPPHRVRRVRRDREFAERARSYCADAEFDAVVGFRHLLACDVYVPHGGSVAEAIDGHRAAKRIPSLPSAKVRGFLTLERELLTGPAPPRKIVAVSEMVKRDLARRFPSVEDRIEVVPNGVDLERFTPEGREAARDRYGRDGVVAFVAANPRLKGWRYAREVFRTLRSQGLARTLLVLGGSPGRLPEGAVHLGREPRAEEVLRAADVLLHPTFYDPFPLVLLESLACGTPVVTTERNGALSHVGRDGPVRAVARPGDVVDTARLAGELIRAAPRDEARRLAERFPLRDSLRKVEEIVGA